jgi:hypothetical protein
MQEPSCLRKNRPNINMVLMVLTQAVTHANKDYLTLTYPL